MARSKGERVDAKSSGPSVVEHLAVTANGIDFYVAAAGPADGPLVVLLHGFPEISYGWRHQILALADAGFRVVAPDQRGYGHTSKPEGIDAYQLDTLAADVVALVDAFGRSTFSLVGHDWGGIVAWRVASDHGERLDRLAILNAPNVDVAFRHMLKSPQQLVKSIYVALFQLPLLPEWALSTHDFDLLAGSMRASSRPGAFSDEDMAVYRQAWSMPGALTAMLGWYRALPHASSRVPVRIGTPTLILWGDRDTALDASFAEDSAALCERVRIVHVPEATHWVHHERPSDVNRLLIGFLAGDDDVAVPAARDG